MSEKISIEEHKKALQQNSLVHRQAFEQELSVLVDKSKKIATKTLIIGGSLAVSYYVVKKIFGTKKKHKKKSDGMTKETVIRKKSSVSSKIKSLIMTEVAVFLMAIAKKQLQAYLEKNNPREDERVTNP